MKLFIIAAFVFLAAAKLLSQLTIAPVLVYIDPISRSGEYFIVNSSDEEFEIEIYFRFAYLTNDSLGELTIRWEDSTDSPRSLGRYVKAYPKKFVLGAKSTQKVKFLLFIPANAEDGLYWTRIQTKTVPKDRKLFDSIKSEDGLNVGLYIVTTYSHLLFYQKGAVQTTLELKNAEIKEDSAQINFYAYLRQGGNSPSWGSAKIDVFDENGDEALVKEEPIAIYDEVMKRFSLDKKALKPGRYTALYYISSEREDIPKERRTYFEPIRGKLEFTVSGK